MRFKLTSTAKKYLSGQDRQTRKRIYKALRLMTKKPPQGDFESITGSDYLFRLRVGKFRALCETIGNHVIIHNIDSRGQIYK